MRLACWFIRYPRFILEVRDFRTDAATIFVQWDGLPRPSMRSPRLPPVKLAQPNWLHHRWSLDHRRPPAASPRHGPGTRAAPRSVPPEGLRHGHLCNIAITIPRPPTPPVSPLPGATSIAAARRP